MAEQEEEGPPVYEVTEKWYDEALAKHGRYFNPPGWYFLAYDGPQGPFDTREDAVAVAREEATEAIQKAQSSQPDGRIAEIKVFDRVMWVVLENRQILTFNIEKFSRLKDATSEQLKDYKLIGGGIGIHWPQLDEDLSLKGLLEAEGKRG